MLQPRFAINRFSIIGVVFVVIGVGLVGVGVVEAQILVIMGLLGALFLLLGVALVIYTGRWGALGDSARLLRDGKRTSARILATEGTGASTGSGEGANAVTTGRVHRIDLELLDTGRQVRLYRYVNYQRSGMFFTMKELEVTYDPSDPRRVAIDWARVPTVETFVAQAKAQANQAQAIHAMQASSGAPFAKWGAHAESRHLAKILTAEQIARGSNGEPVLQLVVELGEMSPPRYARGTVAGPQGRKPQSGEAVEVQLDASGVNVVGVTW